jgi:hypothetical protein
MAYAFNKKTGASLYSCNGNFYAYRNLQQLMQKNGNGMQSGFFLMHLQKSAGIKICKMNDEIFSIA